MFNRMLAPLLLITVQVLCSIMHALPKDLFLRWSMMKFLECVKSWLYKWKSDDSIRRKMEYAFTRKKAYQDLPLGNKLKIRVETYRISRLKAAVQKRTRCRSTLSNRLSKMTAIAVATALTCFCNSSPVAALAPMPSAHTIVLAMPMLVLNAIDDSELTTTTQWDTDSKQVGHDSRASACITDDPTEFVPGTLKPCHRIVKTFAG